MLRQVDAQVRQALEQEAREFAEVAGGGVDRATQQPFRDVRELLFNHLQRQYPDVDEVIVGWVRIDEGGEVLRQQRLPLSERPDVLDPILASAGVQWLDTTETGELRWVKVRWPARPMPAARVHTRACT